MGETEVDVSQWPTPKEAAPMIGVSWMTVIRMYDDKRLRGRNLAPRKKKRRIRINPQSIREFLTSN